MSLSVIFNHFPLRVLSHQPIWILNLLHTRVVYMCARVCFHSCFYPPLHFLQKSVGAYASSASYPPFTVSWLSKLILLWDFFGRSVSPLSRWWEQHKGGSGGAVNVSMSVRSDTEHPWGTSASTKHTHDKAKLVQTRVIPPPILNREWSVLIHSYDVQERFTKRQRARFKHAVHSYALNLGNNSQSCQEKLFTGWTLFLASVTGVCVYA